MSKLKSVNQSSSATAGFNSNSNSQVSSTGKGEIFNDLFDKMHVETMTKQNASDGQQPQQNASDSKSQNAPQVKAKEKSDGSNKKDDTTQSASSSSDDDNVSKASDSGDAESAESSSDSKSLEESDGTFTSKEAQVSMEDLIQQINTALTFITPAEQLAKPQQRDWQNVRVIMKDASPKSISETIDPKLLRKIDVKTLNDQLQKLMQGQDLLQVSPPQMQTAEASTTALNSSVLNEEAAFLPKDNLSVQAPLTNAGDAVASSQADQDQSLADIIKEMTPVAEDTQNFQNFKDSQNSESFQSAQNPNQSDITTFIAPTSDVAPAIKDIAALTFTPVDNAGLQQSTTLTSSQESVLNFTDSNITTTSQSSSLRTSSGLRGSGATKLTPADITKIKTKTETVVLSLARNGKSDSTRIQMHPENLGRIEIRIEMKNKVLRAEVLTDNSEAKEAILQHVPQIKAALASENIKLDYFNARHDQGHFQSQNQAGNLSDHDARSGDGQSSAPQTFKGDSSADEVAKLQGVIHKTLDQDSLINITV